MAGWLREAACFLLGVGGFAVLGFLLGVRAEHRRWFR